MTDDHRQHRGSGDQQGVGSGPGHSCGGSQKPHYTWVSRRLKAGWRAPMAQGSQEVTAQNRGGHRMFRGSLAWSKPPHLHVAPFTQLRCHHAKNLRGCPSFLASPCLPSMVPPAWPLLQHLFRPMISCCFPPRWRGSS